MSMHAPPLACSTQVFAASIVLAAFSAGCRFGPTGPSADEATAGESDEGAHLRSGCLSRFPSSGTAADDTPFVSATRVAVDGEWLAAGLITAEDDAANVVIANDRGVKKPASCSAALIRTDKNNVSNILLTAKHCMPILANGLQSGRSGYRTSFYVGNGLPIFSGAPSSHTLLCDAHMERYDVISVLPLGKGTWTPDWIAEWQDTGTTAPSFSDYWLGNDFDDIMLLELETNVAGVTPLTLVPPGNSSYKEPTEGSLQVMGFGGPENYPGGPDVDAGPPSRFRKRITPLSVAGDRRTTKTTVVGKFPVPSLRTGHGYSGGPAVGNFESWGLRIWGIHMGSDVAAEAIYEARLDQQTIATQIDNFIADRPKRPFKTGGETCACSNAGPSPSDPSQLGIR